MLMVAGNRDFKNIATAGADTAAWGIFPLKWDTAHVRRLSRSCVKSDYVSGDVLRSGCYVGFISLLWAFSRDTLAFSELHWILRSWTEVSLSQRLSLGYLSQGC